jgi:hypothetical protein
VGDTVYPSLAFEFQSLSDSVCQSPYLIVFGTVLRKAVRIVLIDLFKFAAPGCGKIE